MYEGEKFNSISHVVGAALALCGLAMLLFLGVEEGDPWKVVSFTVYGCSLLLLYTFSSLYHSVREPKRKRVFRKLDHLAIYVLIAGTYTPFTLVSLRGPWGWSLFGAVWLLATLGIVCEFWIRSKRRLLPIIIYICMGWLILTAFHPLLQALSPRGLFLLALGGAFYTLGIVFYAMDKKARHFHGIWHLFVLAGSISHYLAVYFYVA